MIQKSENAVHQNTFYLLNVAVYHFAGGSGSVWRNSNAKRIYSYPRMEDCLPAIHETKRNVVQ